MEHENEKIDALIGGLMKDGELEQPSDNFTEKVMNEVYALESESSIVYQPPISRKAWFIIGTCFAVLCAYVVLNGSDGGNHWFKSFDISNMQWPIFEGFQFQFSKILSRALILLALMIGIQVTILKSYFNNRMTY